MSLEPPGGAVGQQPRGLELHLHVGDLVRDRLELADRWPNCVRVRAYAIDVSSSRSIVPTWLANEQMRSQSIAAVNTRRAAADARRATASVGDVQRRRTRARRSGTCAGPSSRTSGPAREPGRAALDQERRDAAVIALLRVGHREHDHDVGHRPVGDERLRAVDAEAGAVALGARAHRKRVGARARLGHRVHADQRAVAQAAEIASLLRLRCRAARPARRRRAVGAQREHQAAVAGSRTRALRARSRRRAGRAPLPPYSSGTGSPWMPISPHWRHSSRENVCSRSRSATPAFSSSRANRTMLSRRIFCSFAEREVHQAHSPSAAGSRSCRSRSSAGLVPRRTRPGSCTAAGARRRSASSR